jgi:outer membrane receptor protein involved in Fe transport
LGGRDHQAYISYQRPFDKLTILAGARAEAVHLDLFQETLCVNLGQCAHHFQSYARLYPNIRASYDLGGGNQWMVSYSRRIVRPGIRQLDPFPVSPASASTTIQGNPDLKPEDISSYELGFEHRKGQNSYSATLYYRSTGNDFSVIAVDQGNGHLLGQDVNAGHLLSGGGELVYSHQITPKLNYNFSVDGYWTEISAPNLGVTQVQTLWTGFGRANLAWQITPKDFLQLNAFINGQGLAVQGRTEPSASGNIGYRHVIDPKTTFTVTIQDPFRSLTYRSVYKTNDGTVRMDSHTDNRFFIFALVRTFGGSKAAPPPDFGFTQGGTAGGAGF